MQTENQWLRPMGKSRMWGLHQSEKEVRWAIERPAHLQLSLQRENSGPGLKASSDGLGPILGATLLWILLAGTQQTFEVKSWKKSPFFTQTQGERSYIGYAMHSNGKPANHPKEGLLDSCHYSDLPVSPKAGGGVDRKYLEGHRSRFS